MKWERETSDERSKRLHDWHEDDNERIHIPIITNNGCHLIIQNSVHHLPADGSAYIADVTVPHTAFNGGWENRYNLLIEVIGYKRMKYYITGTRRGLGQALEKL